jgi:hypothetical protein
MRHWQMRRLSAGVDRALRYAVQCAGSRRAEFRETSMSKAFFMVRAVVADPADRPGFDTWYEKEHLPDALAAFGVAHAWRCWSRTDPSLHFAFYEFQSLAAAEALPGSPALTAMIAEFDRVWGSRVTRSREILEFAGELRR